jgi:hypothetical protein
MLFIDDALANNASAVPANPQKRRNRRNAASTPPA